MNLISGFRASRLINQISESGNAASPGTRKALEKLKKLGPGVIPKIIDAIPSGDSKLRAQYAQMLSSLTSEKTLPLVIRGLADSDPRTVSATAAALTSSRSYNINRLVVLLSEDEYSKPSIIEVLTEHKDRLNIRQLLGQIYNLQPAEKTAVFRLINEIVTEEDIPALLDRLDGKDSVAKMLIIDTVSRFDTPDVHQAIEEALADSNKLVRRSALTSIIDSGRAVDVEILARLLLDPDVDVIDKAVEAIVQRKDPETVKYLLEAMRSENEFSRRAAVEVLNEVGTVASVKYLLAVVGDDDWWVSTRASDALAKIGGDRVVSAVMELVNDKDQNIRRSAIEILNACGDKRALKRLIQATEDDDWWVRERAADALAGIGDRRAIPAIIKMLDRNDKSVPIALITLGKLGEPQVLKKVIPYIRRPEKEVRLAAIEATAMLTDESNINAVRTHLHSAASSSADETVVAAISRALTVLEGKFSPSGRFIGTPGASASVHSPLSRTPTATQQLMPTVPPLPDADGSTQTRTLLVEDSEVPAIEAPSASASAFDVGKLGQGDMIDGRYKYIQKIGKGAFGTVVLVEDTVVEERLILKFLNPNVASDEEMMKRFVHELRYSRKITHKNVIRIYDFLHVAGGYAISMEYFPSHTLSAEIANEKPMPQAKAVGYAIDICTGMQIAHQQGIIHRDLKPANILINDEGLVKIVDFGVAAAAKSGDTQLTKTGYVIGSPKYMAPEQILGKKVDERADIYSLGIILYEMLVGEPPYSRGDHMAVMYQHVQGKAAPLRELNPNLSSAVCDAVDRAMTVDKDKRFKSMEEFHEALLAAVPELAA